VTTEDTQSGAIVLDRNTNDGVEVTHFKITGISNGTLFHTDGTTAINNGDYITYSEGNGGLKFTPTANITTAGSFNVESSVDGTTVAVPSGVATSTITVTPVGDTPQAANIVTNENTQSGAIVLDRSTNDGVEVTHFKITGISNGTLFHTDGTTAINNGDYITVAQGQAGLKFTPSANSIAAGSFDVESSENGVTVAAQSGKSSTTISITPVIETVVTEPTPTIETPTPEIVVDTSSPEPISDEPEPIFTQTPMAIAPNSRIPDLQILVEPVVVTERAADVVLSEGQIQAKTGAAVEEELEAELDVKIVPQEVMEFELDNAVHNSSAPVALEEGMVRVLDQVRDKKGEDILIENPTLSASTGVAASMSVGYVAWLLRGGVLLSSVLSQLPAWRSIDPLPVFSHGGKRDEDEEDESLEAIVQKGSTQRDPVSDHADDAAQPSTQDSADGADEHR